MTLDVSGCIVPATNLYHDQGLKPVPQVVHNC